MISKPTNILTYAKAHPIKSVVLGAFTLFTIIGAGFGTLYVVAPDTAEAVLVGNPCCTTIWDPWGPGGWDDPYDPGGPGGWGGGGGGGGTPNPVCALSANPASILTGGSSTLAWTTTNAHVASINNGVGDVAVGSGTISVSPTETTTYTLAAQNNVTGRITNCVTTITVTPPVVAPACVLTVEPASIELGNSATVSWTTTNGSTFNINGGIGSVTPVAGGNTTVTPGALGTHAYVGVVTSSTGETATCTDSVEVIPPVVVNAPACTLDITPGTITIGDQINIDWETRHGDTFSIDNGVGDISLLTTPIAGGVVKTTPTTEGTVTYTGTVTAADGTTATCSDTVNVLPVGVDAPACTLTTDGIGIGETETTIYWTIANAVSATLNKDTVAPTDGSKTVEAGTYTLTVVNAGGVEVICGLVIEPPLDGPACTLTADKLSLAPGETTTINWTISNATEATLQHLDAVQVIDPSDGSQSAVAGTYTLSVGNGVASDTCEVTIAAVTPGVLSCDLNIDRSSIRTGETADMTWTTNDAVSFVINGEDKDLNGAETIAPAGVQIHTYTGTATDADGNTATCSDTVQVTGGSGGGGLSCAMSFTKSAVRSGETSELRWTTRNANSVSINQGIGSVVRNGDVEVTGTGVGMHEYTLTAIGDGDQVTCRATLTVSGGSGCTENCGGGSSPRITIDFLKGPGEQPLAFVTLSQIPYTGIELGATGTVIYWMFLAVWSGAVAYLLLFKLLPFTGRKLVALGNGVSEAINATEEGTMDVTMHEEMEDIQIDGFAPKSGDEALSVEDIVRGLSRMHQEKRPIASEIVEEEEPEALEADVAQEMELPPITAEAPVQNFDGSELQLLNSLMSGDRDTSFSLLRRSTRNGGRPDLLIEKALVHLDAAYRSRIDGIPCSEDVRRATAALDTALLEEVISALASAIDTTYSQSQTGAKLAVARAHAVIERG